MRRPVLYVLVWLALFGLATQAGAARKFVDQYRQTSQFRVVITGDSILRLAMPGLAAPDRFVDTEDGRQVNTKGITNSLSSTEAVAIYAPLVAPGGYFVFQDNGLGGATQAQWRTLMRAIVAAVPEDRCVVGVLPVYTLAPHNTDVAAKAGIMVQEFNLHPCPRYVRWNQKVAADPTLVYDGQHPTAAGIEYLVAEIGRQTP